MVNWLLAGPVRLPSGAYLSWVSSDNSSTLYAEAAAVAVRTICWWCRTCGDDQQLLRLIPTLAFLEQAVADDGLVRHRGQSWLFDSLLVLCALETAGRSGVPYPATTAVERLSQGCTEMLNAGCASRPADEMRWSSAFGPHLLKPTSLLLTMGMGTEQLRRAIRRALPTLLSCQDMAGAFRSPGENRVYLHAHCYALEGLAVLANAPEQLRKGLVYLLSQRRPDGGFPHWNDTPSPLAADVTAQAGRLFLLCEERDAAARARAALESLAAPSGALYYHAESSHQNSWSTAFAAQLDYGLQASIAATDLA